MIYDNIYICGTFLASMFFMYTYTIFDLAGTILESPGLNKLCRIALGILNTILALFFTLFFGFTSMSSYIFVTAILFAEFWVFHKDTLLRTIL